MDSDAAARLTRREDEVLQLLAKGMSNQEIAAQLGIGAGTVGSYVGILFAKLNARTRTDVVIRAMAVGLLRREPGSE